jgi:hypothetical protein
MKTLVILIALFMKLIFGHTDSIMISYFLFIYKKKSNITHTLTSSYPFLHTFR